MQQGNTFPPAEAADLYYTSNILSCFYIFCYCCWCFFICTLHFCTQQIKTLFVKVAPVDVWVIYFTCINLFEWPSCKPACLLCITTRGSRVLSLTATFSLLDMDQLTQIMKVTGVPGPEFIQKLDSVEVCLTVAPEFCVYQLQYCTLI